MSFTATATDNFGVESITYSQNSGTSFSERTSTVTATATDLHGSPASCQFKVTLTDVGVLLITSHSTIKQTNAVVVQPALVHFTATASLHSG